MKAHGKSWNITITIMLVSILVGLSSCIDKNYFSNISDEVELTPGFALPFAHGSLSIDDLLTKLDSTNIIDQDNDSLLYIFYKADLFSYLASEVINIPDQNFVKFSIAPPIPAEFALPGIGDTIREITIPFVGTKIPLGFDQNLEFTFEHGERIDSVVLKNLRMKIDVTSTFQNELFLDFHADNIKVGGKPWRKIIPLSNSAASIEEVINNFKVQLTFNENTTMLALKINIVLINKGESLRPGDHCDITMSFLDNRFSGVYGYLGEYDILTNEGQFDVSFFSNKILGGSISFANPEMALLIKNSFGLPLQIDLGLDVVSTINTPPVTPITFIGINPFIINTPTILNPDEQVPSEFRINNTNSNFVDAISTSPDHLNYSATARINDGGPTLNKNYIRDSSRFDVGAEVTLPIHFKARGFIFEDTISLDFKSLLDTKFDMIDSLGLTLVVTNEIPLEADIQFYFTDSSYNVLDSMFIDDSNFLEAGILSPDGRHTISVPKTNRIEYTAASLENIKGGKFARFKASLNTPIPASGSDFFKFYSFYKINFNLSANAYLRVNPKNL